MLKRVKIFVLVIITTEQIKNMLKYCFFPFVLILAIFFMYHIQNGWSGILVFEGIHFVYNRKINCWLQLFECKHQIFKRDLFCKQTIFWKFLLNQSYGVEYTVEWRYIRAPKSSRNLMIWVYSWDERLLNSQLCSRCPGSQCNSPKLKARPARICSTDY